MNLFRVRGIMLAVHFSFFLFLAVQAFIGWAEAGNLGAVQYSAVLLACFVCVVLHELGHCFTALHFGIGVRRILLLPIGGMAEFDTIPREPRQELLITIAGPAVNFAIAALLWLALPASAFAPVDAAAESASAALTLADVGVLLMQWNLAMGLFNLLPAFPMDGGRIVRALLATRLPYLRATRWAAGIGKVICAVMIAIALLWPELLEALIGTSEGAPLLAGLFAFILFVGEVEYRATRRREFEDEHLRATLARLYAPPPLDLEPPLLAGAPSLPASSELRRHPTPLGSAAEPPPL